MAQWNALADAHRLSRMRKMTGSRRRKVKARWADPEFRKAWGGPLGKAIAASGFLRGVSDRGWKVSFDWIVENGTNWVKAVEGNYRDAPKGAGQRDGFTKAGTDGTDYNSMSQKF